MAEPNFQIDDIGELETTFGAVALIDILGFKAVRREYDDRVVMRALVAARDTLHSVATQIQDSRHRLRVACFSDTIIAAVEAVPDPDKAIRVLARILLVFLHRAVTDPHRIPLVYRGCLTVGQFAAGGEFFVGPAVDNAAEWYEKSDAALVWLTPGAARSVKEEDFALVPWSVDLKGIGPLDTLAINMMRPDGPGESKPPITVDELKGLYARPFELGDAHNHPEIAMKKQRTMAFLEKAHAHTLGWNADGTKKATSA